LVARYSEKESGLAVYETQEVQVIVTLQVGADDVNQSMIESSVVEAVKNALQEAENRGFVHQASDCLSIGYVDAEIHKQ
jgi:hypothetical protein